MTGKEEKGHRSGALGVMGETGGLGVDMVYCCHWTIPPVFLVDVRSEMIAQCQSLAGGQRM